MITRGAANIDLLAESFAEMNKVDRVIALRGLYELVANSSQEISDEQRPLIPGLAVGPQGGQLARLRRTMVGVEHFFMNSKSDPDALIEPGAIPIEPGDHSDLLRRVNHLGCAILDSMDADELRRLRFRN